MGLDILSNCGRGLGFLGILVGTSFSVFRGIGFGIGLGEVSVGGEFVKV